MAAPASAGVVAIDDQVPISSELPGTRRHPAVAGSDRYYDSFLVVWDETSPGTEGVHILASSTQASSQSEADVVQIDAPGTSINEDPDIAATPDGDFLIVWRRDPNDGSRPYIAGTHVSRWGSGEEFRVNTERQVEGEYYLGAPAVAVTSDNSFIVVWSSGQAAAGPDSGPRSDVFARRFSSDSTPVGNDVAVSTPGGTGLEETEFRPDVAATANGEFVVAWARGEYSATGTQFATFVRRLDSIGVPAGAETRVGTGGLAGPRVDAASSGSFRVVWPNAEIGGSGPQAGAQVLVRSFDAEGTALDGAFIAAGAEDGGVETFAGGEGVAATHGAPTSSCSRGRAVRRTTRARAATATAGESSAPPSRARRAVRRYGAGQRDHGRRSGHSDVATGYDKQLLVVWESGNIYGRRFKLAVPDCADTDANDVTSVRDALFVLQAAVGAQTCDACVCDADGSGAATAADALAVLRESVGIRTTLACPACPDPFSRTFTLESNASCYGIHAELEALPDYPSELACEPNPALAAAGCEVTFGDGLLSVCLRRARLLDRRRPALHLSSLRSRRRRSGPDRRSRVRMRLCRYVSYGPTGLHNHRRARSLLAGQSAVATTPAAYRVHDGRRRADVGDELHDVRHVLRLCRRHQHRLGRQGHVD
jgi:hypothetical protein